MHRRGWHGGGCTIDIFFVGGVFGEKSTFVGLQFGRHLNLKKGHKP